MTEPLDDARPVAWRWKAKGNKHWIYDPIDAWREDKKDDPEIEFQPLYAAPARCDAESAVAAERERCAKIAVEFGTFPGERFIKEIRLMCGNAIADKIREASPLSSTHQPGEA